ncbi:hypothetical protein JXA88_08580 [Candidatus Fermentibacteria bacterium]|nr:hypothetical protein [Candidatus Fermentibacteria bacterium]
MIDSVSQVRFALTLLLCVMGATMAAVTVWCWLSVGPGVRHLTEGARLSVQASESLHKLIDVSANEQLPAQQRASLARAVGMDLASSSSGASRHLTAAAAALANPVPYVTSIVAALVFAGIFGLLWSRRITMAEQGIVRRLEGIVDGDLRLDTPMGPFGELHVVQRGMRRSMEELRSVARREVQLMTEVGDSVRHICNAAANDSGIGPRTRDQLLAAADKIDELRRISQRPRL